MPDWITMEYITGVLTGAALGVILSAVADRDIRIPSIRRHTHIGPRLDHWSVPSVGSEDLGSDYAIEGDGIEALIGHDDRPLSRGERAVVAELIQRERVRRGSR